jgi:glycosyltransferase involved in cell wall biosynthesis
MTRIVFYNHTGQVSGAEKMLLLTLGHLSREQFWFALVCPEDGPLRAAALDLKVPVFTSRGIVARFTYNPTKLFAYSRSILGELRNLRATFRTLTPDLIHAHTVRAGIVATAATLGTNTPIVWHNHDMLPTHPLTFAIRWLAHSSRRIRVVGCSAAAARSLRPLRRNGIEPTVIHNGIELACGRFNEESRNHKREELGLSPAECAIGIVGQLTPRKGHLELIRAFVDVRARLPHSVLIICGRPIFNRDEEYLARLHREVKRLGLVNCVRFLGQRADAPEVIGALDVFVLNSKKEPFALTLIEAMAMGTAVVATNCGGPTEIIRHNVDGEIVEVGDQRALVSAIVRLGRDPDLRQRYCAAAEERVRREHSREKYLARWVKLYREVLRSSEVSAEHASSGETAVHAGGRQ